MEQIQNFWQAKDAWAFEPYGFAHMMVVAVMIILVLLIRGMRDKITAEIDRKIRVISAAIAFLFELLFHVWNYINDENFVGSLFYFDLCSVTLVLAFVFNLGRKKTSESWQRLFEVIYFWGVGAFSALAFPELEYGANKFRFYHFFIIHGYIVLTAAYGLVVERRYITLQAFWRSFRLLVVYGAVVFVINRTFGQNYMFLSHAPEVASPLDLLGDGFEYYFNLFWLGGIVLFLFYLPCGVSNYFKLRYVDALEELQVEELILEEK